MKTTQRHGLHRLAIALCILATPLLAAADRTKSKPGTGTKNPSSNASTAPSKVPGMDDGARAAQAPLAGKVLETTNTAGYTYLLVQRDDRKVWAAASQFPVAVGDEIVIPEGWVMKDFRSPTLNRTFDWILFASKVGRAGEANAPTGQLGAGSLPANHPPLPNADATSPTALPPGHPPAGTPARSAQPVEVKKGSVEKVPGGYTVEECHSTRRKLEGKTIKIRGVVVKFTPSVLGKNWIRLQDGSGTASSSELAVTTAESASVGETIVVEGKIACDRSFGAGYDYAVLLEDGVIRQRPK